MSKLVVENASEEFLYSLSNYCSMQVRNLGFNPSVLGAWTALCHRQSLNVRCWSASVLSSVTLLRIEYDSPGLILNLPSALSAGFRGGPVWSGADRACSRGVDPSYQAVRLHHYEHGGPARAGGARAAVRAQRVQYTQGGRETFFFASSRSQSFIREWWHKRK